jgi:hypothetical protein
MKLVAGRWWRVGGAWVVAAALITACGGDGDDDTDAPTSAPTATVTVAVPSSPAERAAALCASTARPVSVTVQAPEAVEISGIVSSAELEGLLWAHNDSGDTARVIALGTDGAPRSVVDVAGAEATDWEDMAVGPGPLGVTEHLYLGDIGDNAAARPEVLVYRVAEPRAETQPVMSIEGAERIALRYADTPHDAETLLVDPVTGDLLIVTKEIVAGDSGIYRAPANALATGSATLERAGTITKASLTSTKTPPDDASPLVLGVGWLPTGGDISRDGALIAIRTYASVFIWPREDGQSIAEALAGTPCEAPSAYEAQGEAIAFTPDGDGYYTVSEGANPTLYRFGLQ